MNNELLEKIKEYSDKVPEFDPGSTFIPVDNSVCNGDESINLISSVLGSDKDYLKSFTVKMMDYIGYGHLSVTSNALSAHLLVMKALSSPSLQGRGLKQGDEIVTTPNNVGIINAARTFGVVPVVVDVDLNTMLPDPVSIETSVVEGKTKAIVLPSVCGNTVQEEIIRDIADDFSIMLVEDLGYGLGGSSQGVPIGSYADISIFSFHSALLGDAGVIVSKPYVVHELIQKAMHESTDSMWLGLGSSPMIYAYLDAQMDKLEYYNKMRRLNWSRLYDGLSKHSKYFRFHKAQEKSNPSWTGFVITLKEPIPFTKYDLMNFLESRKIGTRSLVGNVFQSESYKDFIRDGEELINSDYIHRNSFVIGCNPSMRQEHVDWIIKSVDEFLKGYNGKEETQN